MSEFKLSFKESIGVISAIGGFFFQWYTLKMEIRESIIKAGFEEKANNVRFLSLETKVSSIETKTNSLENKCGRIFTMLYKEADKPKPFKIEIENE